MTWECPRCRTIYPDWVNSCRCPPATRTVFDHVSCADLDMVDKHGLNIRATCSPECDCDCDEEVDFNDLESYAECDCAECNTYDECDDCDCECDGCGECTCEATPKDKSLILKPGIISLAAIEECHHHIRKYRLKLIEVAMGHKISEVFLKEFCNGEMPKINRTKGKTTSTLGLFGNDITIHWCTPDTYLVKPNEMLFISEQEDVFVRAYFKIKPE